MSCARTVVERQSRAIAASNAFISDPQYAYFPTWRGQARRVGRDSNLPASAATGTGDVSVSTAQTVCSASASVAVIAVTR